MKKSLIALIPLALSILAFIVLWKTFDNPHEHYFEGQEEYPYSRGNAPEEIRQVIKTQLEYFEKGYLERDTNRIEEFCDRLLSKNNILILGTMPGEIYSGFEAATDLIESDWLYWGDVYYLMDQANISVHGDVAWVSTIGYVEFDLSRFLVLPLRYSALMVFEDASWKFQQMQFQFDLDNMKILIALILLLLTSLGFLIRFAILLIKYVISRTN